MPRHFYVFLNKLLNTELTKKNHKIELKHSIGVSIRISKFEKYYFPEQNHSFYFPL
jgi:hypothetical protein